MEFSTKPSSSGEPFIRTYQGGGILAVYLTEDIYLASLLDSKAIIDLPDGFEADSVNWLDKGGKSEFIRFEKCLGGKIVFSANSCRDNTLYYRIRRSK